MEILPSNNNQSPKYSSQYSAILDKDIDIYQIQTTALFSSLIFSRQTLPSGSLSLKCKHKNETYIHKDLYCWILLYHYFCVHLSCDMLVIALLHITAIDGFGRRFGGGEIEGEWERRWWEMHVEVWTKKLNENFLQDVKTEAVPSSSMSFLVRRSGQHTRCDEPCTVRHNIKSCVRLATLSTAHLNLN
jgi:hypothetical protein